MQTRLQSFADLEREFSEVIQQFLPRVLTQVCRDPSSSTYGSFDRNWWHYKIRDFSSIIIQQGGYCLSEAGDLEMFQERSKSFKDLAQAAAVFWNQRAQRKGAFEEYYPWEQGYPPLAFSTLAIAKLVSKGEVKLDDVREGLAIAARQLGTRFEAQAGNQQVAGLAAFAQIASLDSELVAGLNFDDLATRSLALQNSEGWYEEYDGPDLGYLAVTIDCLWDLFDATGEGRFKESAEKALTLIHSVVTWQGGSPGMLNARNTDYIVPYGIARFALEGDSRIASSAQEILGVLFEELSSPEHFLKAIDDRYICHYVGHSFVRALKLIEKSSKDSLLSKKSEFPEKHTLPNCGYFLRENSMGRGLVAARKGGILLWKNDHAHLADFGWLVFEGEQVSVSHWWSKDWDVEERDDGLVVSGTLFSHKGAVSSPFKHMVLRVLSFVCGSGIIGFLKSKLIFKNASGRIQYRRVISYSDSELKIRDEFEGQAENARFKRAPRSSKRHVSSADSYQIEDLSLSEGYQREETVTKGQKHQVETIYRLK